MAPPPKVKRIMTQPIVSSWSSMPQLFVSLPACVHCYFRHHMSARPVHGSPVFAPALPGMALLSQDRQERSA